MNTQSITIIRSLVNFIDRKVNRCNPIPIRPQKPIDGKYKIRSATTKPSLINPLAGRKETIMNRIQIVHCLKLY